MKEEINGHTIELAKSHPFFAPGFDLYADGEHVFHGRREECEKEMNKLRKQFKKNPKTKSDDSTHDDR